MSLATPVAYWRLEEASGTRADSSGNGHSLSASGSPVSRAGKLGDAADFVAASSQRLTTADAAVIGAITDGPSGWTIAGWLYNDDDGTRILLGHLDGLAFKGLSVTFFSAFNVSRELIVQWFDNTATATLAAGGASFTSGAWNFFAVKYDPATDKVFVRTNGTTSAGTSVATKTFTQYGTQFWLGHRGTSPSGTYWDGGIDNVGLWAEALSSADLDTLYASGAGYDPTAAGQPTTLRHGATGRRLFGPRIGAGGW